MTKSQIIAVSFLIASCAADPPEELVGTLAATPGVTSTLGVTTWDVARSGDEVRIVGRDASASRTVEMMVQRDARTPEDRVRIDVVFPDFDTFELTRTGAGSEVATLVGAAVQSDLAHQTTPIAVVSGDDGYGTVSSALSSQIYAQSEFQLGWSLFGYYGQRDVSSWCPSNHRNDDSSAWTFYHFGNCSLDWVSPIGTDCRARVYYSIGGDHWDTCHWEVRVDQN